MLVTMLLFLSDDRAVIRLDCVVEEDVVHDDQHQSYTQEHVIFWEVHKQFVKLSVLLTCNYSKDTLFT